MFHYEPTVSPIEKYYGNKLSFYFNIKNVGKKFNLNNLIISFEIYIGCMKFLQRLDEWR